MTRPTLILLAFSASAAYAASFLPLGPAAARLPALIALAAAISWPTFGLALLLVRPRRPTLFWMDACLHSIAAGTVVQAVAVLFNLTLALAHPAPARGFFLAAHLVLLLATDAVMAAVFLRRSGLRPRAALLLWLLALNAPFALYLSIAVHAFGGLP